MAIKSISLFHIDDDPQVIEFAADTLAQEGLKIQSETDPIQGLELISRYRPEVVLLDLVMPKLSGIQVLERIMEFAPDTEVVLFTGNYSTESAVEAVRKGASDYLEKPIAPQKLRQRMAQIFQTIQRRREGKQVEENLANLSSFEDMLGHSPAMEALFLRIRRLAHHFQTVLVTGESGTGKELVARALHRLRAPASAPFGVCNCSAIPENLFESQLFGHMKGAFTGADQARVGLFEYAQGGTVFLDEIGELPLAAQAKLLRVLQNREVQRLGSPAVHKLDVRVVAATNRDLHEMIAEGRFREDLYYRLTVAELAIPPLRERKEDLPLLTRHFLRRFSQEYSKPEFGITNRAEEVLARYLWPGNVRELENVLAHACIEAESDTIDIRHFPSRLLQFVASASKAGDQEEWEPVSLEELSRRHARRVLESCAGNKVKTAKALGVSRSRLYALLADPSQEKETQATIELSLPKKRT